WRLGLLVGAVDGDYELGRLVLAARRVEFDHEAVVLLAGFQARSAGRLLAVHFACFVEQFLGLVELIVAARSVRAPVAHLRRPPVTGPTQPRGLLADVLQACLALDRLLAVAEV